MNKLWIIVIGLIFVIDSHANVVRINATVGDKTNQYSIKPEGRDFVMKLRSIPGSTYQIKIGKKNFDFVQASAENIIRLAKQSKSRIDPCYRANAIVEVVGDSGAASGAKVCLLTKEPEAKAVMDLLTVFAMGLN